MVSMCADYCNFAGHLDRGETPLFGIDGSNEKCFCDLRIRERERGKERWMTGSFFWDLALYLTPVFIGNIFRNNSSALKGLADWGFWHD